MNQIKLIELVTIWSLSLIFIIKSIWFEIRHTKFSFNILFSLIFLIVFYFGFFLTGILHFWFNTKIPSISLIIQTSLLIIYFYIIYNYIYNIKIKFINNHKLNYSIFNINKLEIHLTWILLMSMTLFCTIIFFSKNGFLFFKLNSYCQIFSSEVYSVSLKRFFYFFIPSTLIIYFLNQKRETWIFLLIINIIFGLLTYFVVGGTRANIIMSFTIFIIIGIIYGWISTWMMLYSGLLGIIIMFWLALKRYKLNLISDDIFYNFFYFTRDTFSPWENLSLLLQNYSEIKFQGILPILRDFYVFIPNWLWKEKPRIILNTANYFTWKILNNHSGLTISPTLIGSLLIMGGNLFIFIGAIIVGLIIKFFDFLYILGKRNLNSYQYSILQSFYFSSTFNIIILIREGLDAFISREVFFTLIFISCILVSKYIFFLLKKINLVQ